MFLNKNGTYLNHEHSLPVEIKHKSLVKTAMVHIGPTNNKLMFLSITHANRMQDRSGKDLEKEETYFSALSQDRKPQFSLLLSSGT